ncbi:hypothetical protein [Porticoccus sp.]
MKIIADFVEKERAVSFSRRLRRKGIPTHVAIFKGNNTHLYGGGPKTFGVWSLVDCQHNDAVILLKDKGHKVEYSLSEDQMQLLENEIGVAQLKKVRRDIAVFVIVFISVMFFVIWSWFANA